MPKEGQLGINIISKATLLWGERGVEFTKKKHNKDVNIFNQQKFDSKNRKEGGKLIDLSEPCKKDGDRVSENAVENTSKNNYRSSIKSIKGSTSINNLREVKNAKRDHLSRIGIMD